MCPRTDNDHYSLPLLVICFSTVTFPTISVLVSYTFPSHPFIPTSLPLPLLCLEKTLQHSPYHKPMLKKKKKEIVTLKSFVQASIYMVKKAELTATLWRLEGILSFRQDSCTSKSGCLRQLKNGFLSYPGQHREGIVCGSAQHKV